MGRRVCTVPGCPDLVNATAKDHRCDDHRKQAARERSRNRPELNIYGNTKHKAFRAAVLARDPICVTCHTARSIIADHHPLDLRDLLARGLPYDDPAAGRGLCWSCHSRHTGQTQPGGWNAR